MKIIIGSDHAGFELKEELRTYLKEQNVEVEDLGVLSDAPADYPDVGAVVAEKIAPLSQVTHTATHFMLRSYKQEGDIMFEKEEDTRLVIHP